MAPLTASQILSEFRRDFPNEPYRLIVIDAELARDLLKVMDRVRKETPISNEQEAANRERLAAEAAVARMEAEKIELLPEARKELLSILQNENNRELRSFEGLTCELVPAGDAHTRLLIGPSPYGINDFAAYLGLDADDEALRDYERWVYDHESAHSADSACSAVVGIELHNQTIMGNYDESVADAYAALRHLQRAVKNDDLIEKWKNYRSIKAYYKGDTEHETHDALTLVQRYAQKQGAKLATMSAQELLQKARHIARHVALSWKNAPDYLGETKATRVIIGGQSVVPAQFVEALDAIDPEKMPPPVSAFAASRRRHYVDALHAVALRTGAGASLRSFLAQRIPLDKAYLERRVSSVVLGSKQINDHNRGLSESETPPQKWGGRIVWAMKRAALRACGTQSEADFHLREIALLQGDVDAAIADLDKAMPGFGSQLRDEYLADPKKRVPLLAHQNRQALVEGATQGFMGALLKDNIAVSPVRHTPSAPGAVKPALTMS